VTESHRDGSRIAARSARNSRHCPRSGFFLAEQTARSWENLQMQPQSDDLGNGKAIECRNSQF
jgi:hypothetical protein